MQKSLILFVLISTVAWSPHSSFGSTTFSDFSVPNDRDGWSHNHPNDGYNGPLGPGDHTSSVNWDLLNGGCLRLDDVPIAAGDLFIAPLKFLGDWHTGYIGGTITFDYKKSEPLVRQPEVWISDGNDRWVTYTTFPSYADTEWHTYSVTLNESDWIRIDFTTSTTWEQTLQNVSDLGIIGDLKIGEETTYLDNFILTLHPIPAPGSFLIASTGISIVVWLRKIRTL